MAYLQGMQRAVVSHSAMGSQEAQEAGTCRLASTTASFTPEAGGAEILSQHEW